MVIYALYLLGIQIFKRAGGLRFPPSIWGLEFAAIVIFIGMQAQRIDLGCRANRTEHPAAILVFCLFTFVVSLVYAYFSWYTTFVLVSDIVFGCIGILFGLLEFVLSLAAYIIFKKYKY